MSVGGGKSNSSSKFGQSRGDLKLPRNAMNASIMGMMGVTPIYSQKGKKRGKITGFEGTPNADFMSQAQGPWASDYNAVASGQGGDAWGASDFLKNLIGGTGPSAKDYLSGDASGAFDEFQRTIAGMNEWERPDLQSTYDFVSSKFMPNALERINQGTAQLRGSLGQSGLRFSTALAGQAENLARQGLADVGEQATGAATDVYGKDIQAQLGRMGLTSDAASKLLEGRLGDISQRRGLYEGDINRQTGAATGRIQDILKGGTGDIDRRVNFLLQYLTNLPGMGSESKSSGWNFNVGVGPGGGGGGGSAGKGQG